MRDRVPVPSVTIASLIAFTASACYISEFPFAFSYSCPTLGVLCANIIKNIEVMIIPEHKLRKRVVFSLDMVSFRNYDTYQVPVKKRNE